MKMMETPSPSQLTILPANTVRSCFYANSEWGILVLYLFHHQESAHSLSVLQITMVLYPP